MKIARKRNSKKRSYRNNHFKVPIASTLGISAGIINAYVQNPGNLQNFLSAVTENYTGVNVTTGDFQWTHLKRGLIPAVTGVTVSKLASRYGVNRGLKMLPVKL